MQGTKSYNAQIIAYDPNCILFTSGNGYSSIDLTNSEVEITANQISIIDLTSSLFSVTVNRTDRFITNNTNTNLFSPDGVTSSIKMTNTALYICAKDHDVVVYNNNDGYAYLGNSWTGTKTYFCAGINDEYLYIQGKIKYRTDSNNSWRTLS